jgi:glutathione S-transferase
MPAYKLIYFDGKGRAEAIRLALTVAGQEFEDVRYSREEWEKVKPSKYCGLGVGQTYG